MLPYYEPPKNEIICPECGSSDITLDENHEVKSKENGKLKQFNCNSCKCMFIPAALIGNKETKFNESIDSWSKKVRMSEGNNNKSWRTYTDFIIIRKI